MTNDALFVLRCIFEDIFSLFTSWYIPGTNVTPALMAVFIIIFVFAIRFIRQFIGGNDE